MNVFRGCLEGATHHRPALTSKGEEAGPGGRRGLGSVESSGIALRLSVLDLLLASF